MPILAQHARVDERNIGQRSHRGPASPRTQSRRAKLLATTLAVLILASATLLSPVGGEAANAGYDGVLPCPVGKLTLLAAAHLRGTTHRDTLGACKATTREPLIAGKHVAFGTKGAG
jgi:hypothetical protein